MIILKPSSILDAQFVSSNVAENDYAAWSSATTYAIGNLRIYVVADKHWVIRSLQNSNLNNVPTGLSTDLFWVVVSQTNRWKMFDQITGSQTTNTNSIEVVLTIAARVDSVALLNVQGTQATITMTRNVDSVEVYNETYSLANRFTQSNWFSWFFVETEQQSDFVVTNLPAYQDTTITISIFNTGGIAGCGTCILGRVNKLGMANFGLGLGLLDYSVKTANEFGEYVLTQRNFSRTQSLEMLIPNETVDAIYKLLSQFRATPLVWVGTDSFESTIVYGFCKDFNISITYPTTSVITIEIEGLS